MIAILHLATPIALLNMATQRAAPTVNDVLHYPPLRRRHTILGGIGCAVTPKDFVDASAWAFRFRYHYLHLHTYPFIAFLYAP
jgi:hypothetical protein